MNCPHRFDGAAYVLGALDPAERATFAAHLSDCEACGAAVHSVTALPGMLAHVDATELLAEPPEPPDDMLPGLFQRVRHDRRKRRIRSALVTAAAILLVGGGTVGTVELLRADTAVVTTGESLTAEFSPVVSPNVWGSAQITGFPEGTQIKITCEYAPDETDDGPTTGQLPYRLMVTNSSGDTDVAGSRHADNGTSHHVTLFSRWPPAEITGLDVQDLNGQSVLTWSRD
ncbi:MAG: anti-sigma factor family protein [Stackebrandtia sp.]